MSLDTEVAESPMAAVEDDGVGDSAEQQTARLERTGRPSAARVVVYGVIPAVVLLLALGVGYLKWQTGVDRPSPSAAAESVQVASETAVAMLAYEPASAAEELRAAADRLTGTFRDDYLKLINDVVIPGSAEKQVSSVVTIPAAAVISATENQAQVLVFVNQETTFGDGSQPYKSISSVKMTLDKDKDNGRWLVSQFEPV